MTSKRLEEIKTRFANGQGNLEDLNEILSDMFSSFSAHFKEIKKELQEIKENQETLFERVDDIEEGLNPVYSIIEQNEDQ